MLQQNLIAVPLVLALALAASSVSAQNSTELSLVEVPGTGIKIQAPDGFEKATSFNGFQQDSTSASVLITVIPGPYAAVAKGFTAKGLASQGMKLLSKKDVKVAGKDAVLLNVNQDAHGQTYEKWISAFGDDSKTTLVAGTFLSGNSDLRKQLQKTVMSATPSNTKTASPKLPFELDNVEGLVLAERLAAMGKMAAYTTDGKIPLSDPAAPLFVAAPSLGNVPITDPKNSALERLNKTAGTKVDKVEKVADITIDEVSGIEIEASGHLIKTDQKVVLYQVMLFPPDQGYILMTGRVGEEASETFLPKFKSLAASWKAIVVAAE